VLEIEYRNSKMLTMVEKEAPQAKKQSDAVVEKEGE
jgi:hypothetical protein